MKSAKVVQISGLVGGVAKDSAGKVYLKVGGTKEPDKNFVQCYLAPKWAIATTDWKAKAGYTYKVRGTCAGISGRVVIFNDCGFIVEKD